MTTLNNGPLVISGSQPAWAAALEHFAGMRGGNSSLPILNCVLLSYLPEDETPSLTRSDRERQLRIRLQAGQFTCGGRGEIAIDTGKLTSLIKALPQAAEVRLCEGQSRVSLTATLQGQRISQFQLGFLPGGDFPLMSAPIPKDEAARGAGHDAAEIAKTHTILAIPGDRLAACMARVSYAMAKQDVRYYLNGMLLEWKAGSLLLVATDGHQLAAIGTQVGVDGGDGQVILPADTVAALGRLGQEAGEEELRIDIAPNLVHVAMEGRELISKLIDGRYPDWRRVVPPQSPNQVTWLFRCEDLAKALARVRILASEKLHGARFTATAEDPERLVVRASNTEQEEADEVLALGAPAHAPVTIGFNIDYLLGVLGACPTDTIAMQVTDGSAAARLTPGTSTATPTTDDPEWVVMPMLL